MTAVDASALYASTRDRFIALVRPLDATEAEAVVPLTPGWTVRQVLAHVCGLNADVAAGMREGLGTDERTAHQVMVRADDAVAAICDEWLTYAEAMEALVAENDFFGRRLAADLVVHLHDVQHALGVEIDRHDEATVSGGRTYATHMPDRWVDATGMRVAIDLGDGSHFEPTDGAGEQGVGLQATPYDFLRSVTGRRSRSQVEALGWTGDPANLLDRFSPYGPLRTVDAEV